MVIGDAGRLFLYIPCPPAEQCQKRRRREIIMIYSIHSCCFSAISTNSLIAPVCKQTASASHVKETSPMQTLGKSGLFQGQMYFSLYLGSNSKHSFSPLTQMPVLQTSFFTWNHINLYRRHIWHLYSNMSWSLAERVCY